jgi:hypothetical protein
MNYNQKRSSISSGNSTELQEPSSTTFHFKDFEVSDLDIVSGGRSPAPVTIGGGSVGFTGGGGGGRGGGGRVICTHFFKKGMIDRDLWRADLAFTYQNLSPVTVRGYQAWAIPYVRLMRRSRTAENFMFPLAIWRAEEVAFKLGWRNKGNFKGKLVRLFLEPLCFAVGVFSAQKEWESLWTEEKTNECT